MQAPSCENIGLTSLTLETSEPLTRPTSQQLTLFAEDTPANLSPSPGDARARQMTAISGLSCAKLLRVSGQLGCCVKTLLGTSRWASMTCFLTWRALGTPAKRLLFRLVPSGYDPSGIEFGFWPTPNAAAYRGGRSKPRKGKRLAAAKKNNWQDFSHLVLSHRYPSPEVAEMVLGFPTGWTEIE